MNSPALLASSCPCCISPSHAVPVYLPAGLFDSAPVAVVDVSRPIGVGELVLGIVRVAGRARCGRGCQIARGIVGVAAYLVARSRRDAQALLRAAAVRR